MQETPWGAFVNTLAAKLPGGCEVFTEEERKLHEEKCAALQLQLSAEEAQKELQRNPSLKSIPRFFRAADAAKAVARLSVNSSVLLEGGPLNSAGSPPFNTAVDASQAGVRGLMGLRARREARQLMLQKKTAELLDEPDLHRLLELLKSKAKTYSSTSNPGESTQNTAAPSAQLSAPDLLAKPDGLPAKEGAPLSWTRVNPTEKLNVGPTPKPEVISYKEFREVFRTLVEEAVAREESRNPEDIRRVREQAKKKFGPFFRARTYLQFGSLASEIGIVAFFSYVVRKVNIKQTRIQLSYYDTIGQGFLREKDVENFVFELIPTLPQLEQLQEAFYPFYVFTAVRRFFFFLDPKRTGKIPIRTLLVSRILPELYELRAEKPKDHSLTKTDLTKPDQRNPFEQNRNPLAPLAVVGTADAGSGTNNQAEEENANWFSVDSALKVYGLYLELDSDQNGMLAPSELARFGSGMLTDEFVLRVFEECQTYKDDRQSSDENNENIDGNGQEMDYKIFLDFVLAMRNKQSRQGIEYLWRLIDIKKTGRVDAGVIRYFMKGIIRGLEQHQLDKGIRIEDVTDEIFDMIRPANPEYITLEDVLNSRMGSTMLSILTDTQAFYTYDNRENSFGAEEEEED